MKLMRTFLIIIFLSGFILSGNTILKKAYADEKLRVAVLDFEAKDVSEQEALKISELIRHEIINSGKFIFIERAQMGQILKEQELQQTGCTDISCAVEMGKILSANKILVGSVMKMGDQIIITGRIVDVENGVAEFSGKSIAQSDGEIVKAVAEFVEKLTSGIKVTRNESAIDENMFGLNFSKNNYFTGSMILFSLSAVSFGGSYYFDTKADSYSDKYNNLADTYNSSTDPDVITRTRNDMDQAKEDADKFAVYRNISLAAGGIFTMAGCYFYYKYISFPDSESVSFYSEPDIMPVFYTNILTRNNSDNDYYFAGGITYCF